MTKQNKSPPKPTPGPWHFQISAAGNSGNIFNTKPTTAYHVGTLTSGSRSEIGVFLANARVIAAAPELLEALETLLQYQTDSLLDDDYSEEQIAGMEDIKQARAAIARAKGAA